MLIQIDNENQANAENIQIVRSSDQVVKLAINNPIRLSGFIRNVSKSDLYIRFGEAKALKADRPYICVPPGSNVDMPNFFIGEIYGIWKHLDPTGFAAIHHYYCKRKS